MLRLSWFVAACLGASVLLADNGFLSRVSAISPSPKGVLGPIDDSMSLAPEELEESFVEAAKGKASPPGGDSKEDAERQRRKRVSEENDKKLDDRSKERRDKLFQKIKEGDGKSLDQKKKEMENEYMQHPKVQKMRQTAEKGARVGYGKAPVKSKL